MATNSLKCDDSSSSSDYRSSSDDLDDFLLNQELADGIKGYQFQPRCDSYSSQSSESDGENAESSDTEQSVSVRLSDFDKNWCTCESCQIMDREVECVCCQEIPEVVNKNEEVYEREKPPAPYPCITTNPGFQAVCLNRWVLQAAWFQYKQQYGTAAVEGPEHKINRHVAYRQLVRWCWGVLGREVRVVLPSCAVSCIRAHFPPPGQEDDFEFIGFHFADE